MTIPKPLCAFVSLAALLCTAEDHPVIDHGYAAKVNGGYISRLDIEARMNASQLIVLKTQKVDAKLWTKDDEAGWDKDYVERYSIALRQIVRERLKLEQFQREHLQVDQDDLDAEQQRCNDELRKAGNILLNPAQAQIGITNRLRLRVFDAKIFAVDPPTAEQVTAYWKSHESEFPKVLSDPIRERIAAQIVNEKIREKENAWFREALKEAKVSQIVDNKAIPLPIEFFFLEDEIVATLNDNPIHKHEVESRMHGVAEFLDSYKTAQLIAGTWLGSRNEHAWNRVHREHFFPALRDVIQARLKLNGYLNREHPDFAKALATAQVTAKIDGEFQPLTRASFELPKQIFVQLYDQIAAKVNSESISIFEIEERMDPAAQRLLKSRKEKERVGAWTPADNEEFAKKYEEFYAPALRTLIRETLKKQYFKIEKIEMIFDEQEYENELHAEIQNTLATKPLSKIRRYDIVKRVEDKLKLRAYDKRFENSREKEDAWFREVYAKSLVVRVIEGTTKPLPITFFFPDKQPETVKPETLKP